MVISASEQDLWIARQVYWRPPQLSPASTKWINAKDSNPKDVRLFYHLPNEENAKKCCYLLDKGSGNLLCTLERSWKVFDFILAFMKSCLNLFSGAYTTEALTYWNRETTCLTADTISQRVEDFNAGLVLFALGYTLFLNWIPAINFSFENEPFSSGLSQRGPDSIS